MSLRWLLALVLFSGILVAGCDGSSSAETDPTATSALLSSATTAEPTTPLGEPSVAPSAAAAEPAPSQAPPGTAVPGRDTAYTEPSGARILEDVVTLSVGPRASATQAERIAAEEIADRLRGLGYEVSLQEFSVASERGRSSVLSLLTPVERTVPTLPLENSPTATVTGRIVLVPGVGSPGDFPAEVDGAIALIERGSLFFSEKVQNAAAAGAIAVIIYNNEAGTFFGSADIVPVPTVTISQKEGQLLVAALQAGEVTAEVGVGSLSDATSQNVIAKPPGADCETISGGHYDSVPQANGASDNASGTATVLEIAAVLMHRDTAGNHCFVLFGAEELGLLGSRHFLSVMSLDERNRIKAMLNFDMVGVGDITWWLIGDTQLTTQMSALAADLGIVTRPANLVGTSSDHASFLAAGIPALMIHRWEDPLLHTPQDVSDRVRPELLEQAAIMGIAMLEALGAQD